MRIPSDLDRHFNESLSSVLFNALGMKEGSLQILGAIAVPRWFSKSFVDFTLSNGLANPETKSIEAFILEVSEPYGEGLAVFPPHIRYSLLSKFFEFDHSLQDKCLTDSINFFRGQAVKSSHTSSKSFIDIDDELNRKGLYLTEANYMACFSDSSERNLRQWLDCCILFRREPFLDLAFSRHAIKSLDDHFRIGTPFTEEEISFYQFLRATTSPWRRFADDVRIPLTCAVEDRSASPLIRSYACLELAKIQLRESGGSEQRAVRGWCMRCIEIAEQVSDHYLVAEANRLLAKLALRVDDYPSARSLVETSNKQISMHENIQNINLGFFKKHLLLIRAEIDYFAGAYDDSEDICTRIISLSELDFDQRAIGHASKTLARIYFQREDYLSAIVQINRAIKYLQREIDKLDAANAMHVKALVLVKVFENELYSRQLIENSLLNFSEPDVVEQETWIELRLKEVKGIIQESDRIFSDEYSESGIANNRQLMSRISILTDDLPQAQRHINESERIRRKQEDQYGLGTVLLVKFEILVRSGYDEEAVQCLSEALEIHHRLNRDSRIKDILLNMLQRLSGQSFNLLQSVRQAELITGVSLEIYSE